MGRSACWGARGQAGGARAMTVALDHKVVLVCQSGARATKALETLVEAGKSNLRLLQGGGDEPVRA